MNIGKMRHRITIQYRDTTADGGGGTSATWKQLGKTYWAYFRVKSAAERFQAQRNKEQKTYVATIRYRSDVTTAHRVKFGDRYFNIIEVKNLDERDEFMDLVCVEGAAT